MSSTTEQTEDVWIRTFIGGFEEVLCVVIEESNTFVLRTLAR